MTKKSVKFLALMAALLLALSGCSMIAVDPVKDAAEAIVKVNDVTLTKGDLQTDFNNNVAYSAMMYSYYGMAISMEEVEDYSRDSFVNACVEELVQLEKARELGLDQFSEEEEAQLQASIEESWMEVLNSYESIAVLTEDMTEEEKTAALMAAAEGYGVTRESYEQDQRNATILERVYDYAVSNVSVSASEVQTAYEEKLAADETSYSGDSSYFEQAVLYGETVTWVPEGYRTVLHVLLGYEDEVAEEMTNLQVELDEIETRLADAEANGGELALEEGEEDVTVESLTTRKGEIETRMGEVEAEFLAANQATVDEIKQRLADGEDIRVLVAEYGDDTGMMEGEAGYENGYYVSAESTTWDPNFVEGAMALENVGDLSEPVFTFNGLHLIYYLADVAAGPVPMENVSEDLEATLLANAQSASFAEQLAQWQEAYEVQTWPERLEYTGE